MSKWWKQIWATIKAILNGEADIPDVPPVVPPIVDPQPQPGAMAPIKIAHGDEGKMPEWVKGGEICRVNGTQLRMLVLRQLGFKDRFVTTAAAKAGAVRVRDGQMVADDWKVAGGVMVFQYWTLGTSDISKKSLENPVKCRHDSRVWYTFCKEAGQ
jgi:hypothetical protein